MEKELHKRMQPQECIKYLKTIIPENVLKRICPSLPEAITENEMKYEISLAHDQIIKWERSQLQQLTGINGELQLTEKYLPEPYICCVMLDKELLEHVQSNTLLITVQSIQEKNNGCKTILLIYCPEASRVYGRFQTCIEESLTKLQIMAQCIHRILRGAKEFNRCVLQFSKSIAEEPYKTDKLNRHSSEYFLLNDNKDCVPVKGTAGLTRLFQQHLTRLSGVTLEIAEAIICRYSTPSKLMDAFELEGPNLLAEIPVKRSAENLKTYRKIGQEISKKLHTLYTSQDEEEYL